MGLDPLAFNIRHLRAVAAIASAGSLIAAADAIGLSQPALTQALAGIERHLGALFVRGPNGMAATASGVIVAARADEASAHLADGLRGGASRKRGFAQPERLVTTAQLRALLALADAGSFVAAAQATGLSQPSLHRSVRDVERLTGMPLVERRGRGVVLTEQGRRAARGFRLAVLSIGAALAEIAALAGDDGAGELRIGAMPLSRARLLPTAITAFRVVRPGARITIVEGAHRELVDLLRDGRIDLAVGALRAPSPAADIVQRPLLRDRLAIVGRAGHPLAGPEEAPGEALARYPWIVGLPGSPLRQHWEGLFAPADRPPAPIDCGSVMTIRGLLIAGDYLTLLSPDQIGLELRSGLLALVGAPLARCTRTIGITTRAGWRPTAEQSAFLDCLDDAARTGLPFSE